MKTLRATLLFALFSAAAYGQKFNPVTQIRWTQITGAGTPTAVGVSCSASNYGQPYQNVAVTPNTFYTCGTDGWAIRGGGGSGTVTSVTVGNLPPLFTSNVATGSSTPSVTFSFSSAPQNYFFAGPATGGAGAPAYRTIAASDLPSAAVSASLTGVRYGNGAPSADTAATGSQIAAAFGTTAGAGSKYLSDDGTQHTAVATGIVNQFYGTSAAPAITAYTMSGDCTLALGVISCLPNINALSGTTPVITAAHNAFYSITLSAATTPTVTGIVAGDRLTFHICQGSTAFTWAWPAAFKSPGTVGSTINTCTNEEFVSFDGTTLTPVSIGVSGVTP